MKNYTMPLYERETHITYNAEDAYAVVDTFDPTVIRKLDKLVSEYPEKYRLVSLDDYRGNMRAKYEVADKKLIGFRKPSTRTLSEERRAELSERMKRIRNASV